MLQFRAYSRCYEITSAFHGQWSQQANNIFVDTNSSTILQYTEHLPAELTIYIRSKPWYVMIQKEEKEI